MTMDVKIVNDRVCFGDRLYVRFERTLRIPDDGRTYPLPPSFGPFPVRRVDDFLDRVPEAWRAHGGVFLPMHAREAMWLSFQGAPTALKVGVGKVCALTGAPFDDTLSSAEQDYLVAPEQPWLDGICVKKGVIRQFVGVPLGLGATVEGQVTGEESVGGVQLVAFAPRPGFVTRPSRSLEPASMMPPMIPSPAFVGAPPTSPGAAPTICAGPSALARRRAPTEQMGLGAGGTMGQTLRVDRYGAHVWDTAQTARCFVHLVSAADFADITGEPAPSTPVDARAYAKAGFPFYTLDDHGAPALSGSATLAGVKSVQSLVSPADPEEDAPIEPAKVKTIGAKLAAWVRDGLW